jgi:hypothetical protein
VGADFSRIQVAEARRLAAAAGVANARFEVADAQVQPFGAGSFDVVLSWSTSVPPRGAAGVLAGLSPAQAAALTGKVRDGLAAYASPAGVVMPAAAWLVTAQAV